MLFGIRHALHEALRPSVIRAIRPTGNQYLIARQIVCQRGKSPIFHRIIFRCHVSSAAPVFIPDSPIFYIKRSRMPIFGTLLRIRCGPLRRITVINPVPHMQRRDGSQVCRQIGLCPHQLAEIHEFMRTDLIGFIAIVISGPPVRTYSASFPDAIAPIIGLRKAPAWPT